MGSQNRAGKLPEHSSTLNAFLSLKGVRIWIELFQGDMFSYKSILFENWNHSICMRDDQVMAKTQSWGQRKKTGQRSSL